MTSPLRIAPVEVPQDLPALRGLFLDYIASLGIDLGFQGVEAELAGLPGKYAPPLGALLLARGADGAALGCVALRPLAAAGECEIKRLYVSPAARGLGLGRLLAEAILAEARAAGHHLARLDTLADMAAAQRLYAALGFVETPPYYDNPLPGTRYMALALR